jgi:hypothetical protein
MQPKAKPVNKLSKYDYWKQHINKWEESGLSQSEYRGKHGLSPHLFSYWKKKLKSQKVPAALVAVSIQPDSLQPLSIQPDSHQNQPHSRPESASGLSLRFGDGIRLDIEEHFNTNTLRRVMSVIGSR